MKATQITLSVVLAFSAIAAQAQSNPAAAGIAGASVGSKISGTVSLSGGGSSESSALNKQLSSATVTTATSSAANNAAAAVTGTTFQTGSNQAWNYTVGNGSGTAASQGTNSAGTLGIANVNQIGVGSFAPVGLTGDLAGAGGSLVTIGDNTSVGTNQGQISATQGNGTWNVTLGASTGSGGIAINQTGNGSSSNNVTLSTSTTGDVSVSAATGNVNLQTGLGPVQGDGSQAAIYTNLGGGTNTPTGTGGFVAGASGNAAVIDATGTGSALIQSINPGVSQLATVTGL
jgi:hypothetical protein